MLVAGVCIGADTYADQAKVKLGKDGTGIFIHMDDANEPEIVSVGSFAIANPGDRLNKEEAAMSAGLTASSSLLKFLYGSTVSERNETASKINLQVSSESPAAMLKVDEVVHLFQQETAKGNLRGVRHASDWESADGTKMFRALAFSRQDIQRATDLTNELRAKEKKSPTAVQVLSPAEGPPTSRWVVATGKSSYNARDVDYSRRAAILDALQAGVIQIAGGQFSGKSVLKDAHTLQSSLKLITAASVKSVTVISEKIDGDQYAVEVEAEVVPSVGGSLEIISACLGSPEILVLGQKRSQLYKPQIKLPMDDLLERLRACKMPLSMAKVQDAAYTNPEIALRAAQNAGARVIVWADDSGWFQATDTATGELICPRVTGQMPLGSPVSASLFSNADFQTLQDNIFKYWNDEVFNGSHILLNVKAASSPYNQSHTLREVINSMPSVRDCKQIALDASTGEFTLRLRVNGDLIELLDDLAERSKGSNDLSGFAVQKQMGNFAQVSFR